MRESNTMGAARQWYEASYRTHGRHAQRRYPNEELVRFMARHYFAMPPAQRSAVRVLELGCGSGGNMEMLEREAFTVVGFDLAVAALALAREIAPRSLYVGGDMMRLPFADASFSAIVDVFSSYCLTVEQYEGCLREITRTLAPNGRYFCYTPSVESDAFRDHAPAEKLDAFTLNGIHRPTSPFIGNEYPFRFADRDDLTARLRCAGMAVESSETITRSYRNGGELFQHLVLSAVKD